MTSRIGVATAVGMLVCSNLFMQLESSPMFLQLEESPCAAMKTQRSLNK